MKNPALNSELSASVLDTYLFNPSKIAQFFVNTEVDQKSGSDKNTRLHIAVLGGSLNSVKHQALVEAEKAVENMERETGNKIPETLRQQIINDERKSNIAKISDARTPAYELCKALILAGAKVDAPNREKATPLTYAKNQKNKNLISILSSTNKLETITPHARKPKEGLLLPPAELSKTNNTQYESRSSNAR